MVYKKKLWCAVPGCSTYDSCHMHTFPKNEVRSTYWCEAIGVSKNRKNDRICSKHFVLSDYHIPPGFGRKVLLKPSAVPSQSLPTGCSLEVGANVVIKTVEETTENQVKLMSNRHQSPASDHSSYCLSNSHEIVRRNEELLSENVRLARENNKLRRLMACYKSRWLAASRSKEVSKPEKEKIVRDCLAGKFSTAQVDAILSSKPKKFSKKYSNSDFKQAMSLRILSQSSLKAIRKKTPLLLPSLTSLRRKFSFVHVCPGIIQPMIKFFLQQQDNFMGNSSLCALSFDEMNLKETADLDTRLDRLVGPSKMAQTVMVRGIVASWKFPVFVDFDMAITKPLLLEIICALESVKLKVLIALSDMGPKNRGLVSKSQLNIGEECTFANPFDSSREVLFAFDWVHVFKNLRNHLLDDIVCLQDGTTVSRSDFQDLFDKIAPEITAGYKLKDRHLNCKGTERQNVRLAVQLLSKTVSNLLKLLFPNDPVKQALSDFVLVMNDAFDIMNSRVLFASDPNKSALEVYFDQQQKTLHEALHLFESTQFNGRDNLPFQKGAKMAIICALKLHQTLKEKYSVPYLMTSRMNQDCLESFFGDIRKRGSCMYDHPSALEFCHRVGLFLVEQFLDYDSFDIDKLKEALDVTVEEDPAFDIGIEIDSDGSDNVNDSEQLWCRREGLFWIAGFCAAKMRNLDSSLGSYKHEVPKVSEKATSFFTDSMNRGGLSYPTVQWLKEVHEAYNLFCEFHPEDSLKSCSGIVRQYSSHLHNMLPHRDLKIIQLLSRTFTRIRIRFINSEIVSKKTALRAKLKTVQYAHTSTTK